MKQPNKNYNDFIFQGSESREISFHGKPVIVDRWYVGDSSGHIHAGPYVNERHAELAAEQMTNTVGT
jgi:hypothetical protein